MDFRSLNYFVQAAKTLNFTKAAKICYISQTAISLSISKLEAELGFVLFERNNRSMRLTPAGRDFYEWANQTLHSYEKAVDACRNIASGYTGIVNIGFGSSYEGLWFISQLQSFRKRFSDVQLEQRIISAPDLLTSLQSKDIDAFIAPAYDYFESKALSIQDMDVFPMVLVMNKHHPLANLVEVPISVVNQQHCVILTYQGMPSVEASFRHLCQDSGIQFKELRQMERMEEILLYLVNSDSVAFLPSFIANYINEFLVTRPLANCNMSLTFSFYHLKSNKNPVLTAMDTAMQQHYALRG